MPNPVKSGAFAAPVHRMPVDLDGAPALSAESMLIYCQIRLGSMDTEIKGMMDAQREAVRRKEVLNELKRELQACSNSALDTNDGASEADAVRGAIDAYDKAIEQLPPDDPMRKALETQKQELFFWQDASPSALSQGAAWEAQGAYANGVPFDSAHVGAKTGLSDESWKSVTDGVDNLLEGINDDAEIRMIELQSLMSARQTAISLTTNILNKIQQAEQSVVDNIR
jgi:hypothetical protein